MNIPFFSLKRQWEKLQSDIIPAMNEILDIQMYIGGKAVQSFEKKFAHYTGASHAISCNSGTDALWLALKALDLKPKSLVLTTPFSFIASSSEIVAHGATPVFIDIDKDSYNLSTKKLHAWLEEYAEIKNGKTVHIKTGKLIEGIIAVNIFGLCADFTALRMIAKKWNLWIVEDAAQSIGATHKEKKSGSLGDIACFSFYPTKNLGAFGDGGAMTTNDEKLAERLIRLRNHGRSSHYNYEHHGINSRLDALQAVVLEKKLAHLADFTQRRQAIAARYKKAFSSLSFLTLPQENSETHVYHQFSMQVPLGLRDAFIDYLEKNNIGARIFYPEGLHTIPFLTKEKDYKTTCSVADSVIKNIVSLPIWPEMTDEEVSYVCDVVQKFQSLRQKVSLQEETQIR